MRTAQLRFAQPLCTFHEHDSVATPASPGKEYPPFSKVRSLPSFYSKESKKGGCVPVRKVHCKGQRNGKHVDLKSLNRSSFIVPSSKTPAQNRR